MFRLFRKNRRQKPPADWMKWGAVALLAYAIFLGETDKKAVDKTADGAVSQEDNKENDIIEGAKKAINLDPLQ